MKHGKMRLLLTVTIAFMLIFTACGTPMPYDEWIVIRNEQDEIKARAIEIAEENAELIIEACEEMLQLLSEAGMTGTNYIPTELWELLIADFNAEYVIDIETLSEDLRAKLDYLCLLLNEEKGSVHFLLYSYPVVTFSLKHTELFAGTIMYYSPNFNSRLKSKIEEDKAGLGEKIVKYIYYWESDIGRVVPTPQELEDYFKRDGE